ncbi:MAG: hypothetical protein ACYCSQ_02005 [bacterium]
MKRPAFSSASKTCFDRPADENIVCAGMAKKDWGAADAGYNVIGG